MWRIHYHRGPIKHDIRAIVATGDNILSSCDINVSPGLDLGSVCLNFYTVVENSLPEGLFNEIFSESYETRYSVETIKPDMKQDIPQ